MRLGDPAAHHPAHPLLELVGVDDPVGEGPLQLRPDLVADRLEHLGVLVEAPGLDLRARDHLAPGDVDGREDRDEALVAEHAAIGERSLGDVAHARTVDEDIADRHGADDARDTVLQIHHHAVLREHDAIARNARALRESGVGAQVTPLAVHGHDVARLHDVVGVEQFPGRAVPRHVHEGIALVHDGSTAAGQPVDHAIHGVLVAGDEGGGKHDRVVRPGLDLVVVVGDAGQDRHRLALRPGADQHHLVIG